MNPSLRAVAVGAFLIAACCPGRPPPPAVPASSRARARVERSPQELFAREWTRIPVTLTNEGPTPWERGRIFVSFRVRMEDGQLVPGDMQRSPIPREGIPAGGSAPTSLAVQAPRLPGTYRIEVGIAGEGGFVDTGAAFPIRVTDMFDGWSPPATDLRPTRPGVVFRLDGHDAVNRLQRLVARTLESNRVAFPFAGELASGYSAGVRYAQIWARDGATIVPYARFFDDEPTLTGWIRAHLSAQAADGEGYDWIREGGARDKNSVASDQEASLVIAAASATDVIGPAWLARPVDGVPVIERLDRALQWLLRARRDDVTGLLWSGHTADWGDVSTEFPDQRAIDLTPHTPLVVGIYTQAIAYQAMRALARLWTLVGDAGKSQAWTAESERLQGATQRMLWDPARGDYRIHRHVGSYVHPGLDEDAMFAMGGNVTAIRAGLAGDAAARSIVAVALERTARIGVSTISGVLLPPYPAGFFTHDQMDEEFEYQNGGQWDWFGGRLVAALSPIDRDAALRELEKIAEKDLDHGGFFEWDAKDGTGHGSPNFTGSAAVLGAAVVEAIFGIDWNGGAPIVAPHFDGFISVATPGGRGRVAYAQTHDAGGVHWELDADVAVRFVVPKGATGVQIDGSKAHVDVPIPPGRHRIDARGLVQ